MMSDLSDQIIEEMGADETPVTIADLAPAPLGQSKNHAQSKDGCWKSVTV